MTTESRFAAVERQVSCDLGEESVVLKLDGAIYYGLNEVGSRVWKLLQEGPQTLKDLVATIVAEYEVEPAQCEADIRALLEDLAAQQLIEERTE